MVDVSISKGCFLSKPKSSKAKRLLPKVTFKPLPGETERDAQRRQKAFECCWSRVEGKIKEELDRTYESLFGSIKTFLNQSTEHLASVSENSTRVPIPTALVYTGISYSSSDSSALSCLRNSLISSSSSSSSSPVVVLLKTAHASGTNMKSVMKDIMQQLVDWNKEEEDISSCLRLPDCSMSTLCSWYSKYSEGKEDKSPVCILIDGFESFPLNVFQDLVDILSSRMLQFPVLLVLGLQLSASSASFRYSLSASTLSCLSITEFATNSPESFMRHVLELISLDQSVPLKINPDCVKALLDYFKYTDSSIISCTRQIKWIVLEHFYWQPLSFLSTLKPDQLNETVQSFTPDQCEMIRATPSFKSFLEQQQSTNQIVKLMNHDGHLKAVALQQLRDLEEYCTSIGPLLQCLSCFTIGIDGRSLANCKMEILDAFYQASDESAGTVDKLLEHFSVLSTVEFKQCVFNCIEYLKKHNKLLARKHGLQWPLGLLETLLKHHTQLDELLENSPVNYQSVEETKQAVTLCLRDFFSKHLPSVKSLPLHEIYHYTDAHSLSKQLAVSPQQSIIRALDTPQYYLKTPDTPPDSVPLPYVSVAYQEYSTAGRIISLPEWMQACCVSEDQAQLLQQQAGFLQSISEMQFIGLHKPLPHRTNSVMKLYWDTKNS